MEISKGDGFMVCLRTGAIVNPPSLVMFEKCFSGQNQQTN